MDLDVAGEAVVVASEPFSSFSSMMVEGLVGRGSEPRRSRGPRFRSRKRHVREQAGPREAISGLS